MAGSNKEVTISNMRNQELLRISLKNVIEEIAEGISAEEFQRIVTTLHNKTPAAQKLYKMQQSAIVNDIHQSIDYMCTESGIDKKYNDIKELITNTNVDICTESWRPDTGDCEMQLYPIKRKVLEEKKKKLEKLVQEERRLSILMKSTLAKKRNLLNEQQAQILSTKTKINQYYDACGNID